MLGRIAGPSVMDMISRECFVNFSRSGSDYLSAPVSDKDRMVMRQFYMQ